MSVLELVFSYFGMLRVLTSHSQDASLPMNRVARGLNRSSTFLIMFEKCKTWCLLERVLAVISRATGLRIRIVRLNGSSS